MEYINLGDLDKYIQKYYLKEKINLTKFYQINY